MTITVHELLGLVKDDKAPEKIKHNDNIYVFKTEQPYFNICYQLESDEKICLNFNYLDILNDEIEIIE